MNDGVVQKALGLSLGDANRQIIFFLGRHFYQILFEKFVKNETQRSLWGCAKTAKKYLAAGGGGILFTQPQDLEASVFKVYFSFPSLLVPSKEV